MKKMMLLVVLGLCLPFSVLAQRFFVENDGIRRSYIVHFPNHQVPKEKVPVWIYLHGYYYLMETVGIYTNIDKKADKEGFIAVYPVGRMSDEGNYYWDAGNNVETDLDDYTDARYIEKVIDDVIKRFPVDPSEITLLGHSNGSMMAHRVATLCPEKIKCAVMCAGPLLEKQEKPTAKTNIVVIHGDQDKAVPINGGSPHGFKMPSAMESVQKWIGWNNCTAKADTLINSKKETILEWKNDKENVSVQFITIKGFGHEWPKLDNCNWEATDKMWDYVSHLKKE